MRIGIDLRPLQDGSRYRGIGRVVEKVVENITHMHHKDDKLVFYYNKDATKLSVVDKCSNCHSIGLKRPLLGGVKYIRAISKTEVHIQVSPKDIDVLLQFDVRYGVPTNVPCVTIFYDIIPILFKEEELRLSNNSPLSVKSKLSNYLFWKKYEKSLSLYQRSAKIVSISESSKIDLLQHFPSINPDIVSVSPLGVDVPPKNKRIINEDYLQSTGLRGGKYLLYVGGIDYRKNVTQLLSSFFKLNKSFSDIDIVFVGKEFNMNSQLENIGWNRVMKSNRGMSKLVKLTGYVSDDDLRCLYKNALAFVFPSKYEGFGLPVLEAMQMGCPVIAYRNSSIPEVAGDAAILVPDGESLIPSITRLIREPKLRKDLIRKGYMRCKLFTWENTTSNILSVIDEATGVKK